MLTLKHAGQIVLLSVVISFSPFIWADTEKTAIEKRADQINKLLNESSGAKQVIEGFDSEAKEKRDQALQMYENARQQIAEGKYKDASNMLRQSASLMFVAIRLSTPTVMIEKKIIDDYAKRKDSVVALRDAFNRISDENNDEESKLKVNQQLDHLVSVADQLLNTGEVSEARIEMDKAYHLVKVSIEAMRSGQTLVRSLQFESPREEYLYEIDRNDTHNMLIGLLVDEKKQTASIRDRISKNVDEAVALRKQAETYAGVEAYEQAIELLEQSTKQLVKAIRSAGIYIPG